MQCHIDRVLASQMLVLLQWIGVFCVHILAHDSVNELQQLAHLRESLNERKAASFQQQVAAVERNDTTQEFRYLNAKTEPYQITSLPEFGALNLGELYSGSVAVPATNGSLFFVFKPSISGPVDEITIWLNGGPGCSSLEGFLQENGPFVWYPGAYKPEVNPYAWSNLTNVLWVEYPFGTGFSQGPIGADSEEKISKEFVRWFKAWQQLFAIKDYKIYVTGESYAGRYVPYISSAMLDAKDNTYYNLSGALIYDGLIAGLTVQFSIPSVPIIERFQNVLNLNTSTVNQLIKADQDCSFADFRKKYMVWPPAGIQPTQIHSSNLTFFDCALPNIWLAAATNTNPCVNVHALNQQCPFMWDPLDQYYPGPDNPTPYFNRADVKKAIHAPEIAWSLCSDSVFPNGDNSDPSTWQVLPRTIEATNRVLVVAGSLDGQLGPDGLLLAIQNMTWNGQLGFQNKPTDPVYIDIPDLQYGVGGPQGLMGIQHGERGLLYTETFLGIHEGPMGQPRSSYRHLQWLLGKRETL